METPKIFESEYRFCLLLWEYEPINSTHLAHLCREKLGWSKATTYTVLRRLAERGVLKNENAMVTSGHHPEYSLSKIFGAQPRFQAGGSAVPAAPDGGRDL